MVRLMVIGGLGVLAAAALTPASAEAQRGGFNRGGGGGVHAAQGGWRGGAMRAGPRGNFTRGPRYAANAPGYRGTWRGGVRPGWGYGRPGWGYGRPGWGYRPGWGGPAFVGGVALGFGGWGGWGGYGGWGGGWAPVCDIVPDAWGRPVERCW